MRLLRSRKSPEDEAAPCRRGDAWKVVVAVALFAIAIGIAVWPGAVEPPVAPEEPPSGDEFGTESDDPEPFTDQTEESWSESPEDSP